MAVGTQWRRNFSLAHISDDRLAVLAQGGNRRAMEQLLYRYRPVAEARASDYFWAGADSEDVIQEGMIGLYKAVLDYSQKANMSFQSFARLCIRRQIITALKAATRHKHAVLNCSASIAQPIERDELTVLRDVIAGSEATNPERIIVGRETWENICRLAARALSHLKWQALVNYVGGQQYQDIADQLGCNAKQIDNALQRAKKKIISELRAQISN